MKADQSGDQHCDIELAHGRLQDREGACPFAQGRDISIAQGSKGYKTIIVEQRPVITHSFWDQEGTGLNHFNNGVNGRPEKPHQEVGTDCPNDEISGYIFFFEYKGENIGRDVCKENRTEDFCCYGERMDLRDIGRPVRQNSWDAQEERDHKGRLFFAYRVDS